MPPEANSSIELSNQSCRLCLSDQRALIPLTYALTQDELNNIIEKLLMIDLNENLPFNSACNNCIIKVRLIESVRSEFDKKNRIFDVLWTQYKRIHLQAPSVGSGKSVSRENEPRPKTITAGYIIGGVMVEKTELEVDGSTIIIKSESDSTGTIIKREEYDQEDCIIGEDDAIYDELSMVENVLDESHELIEEDKEDFNHHIEEELLEEHIVMQDDENDIHDAEETDIHDAEETDIHDAEENDIHDTEENDIHDVEENDIHDEEDNDSAPQQQQQDDPDLDEATEDYEKEEEEEEEETIWHDEGYFDQSIHRCYLCMDTLDTVSQLNDHLEASHKRILPFHCDKCLTYYGSVFEVNQHLIMHMFPFVCLYCPRKYCNEELLLQHNKECRAYRCPHCSAEFQIMAHLNAHKKKHKAQQRAMNKCKTCGKTFAQACNLQRHTKSRSCGSTEHVPKRKRGRKTSEAARQLTDSKLEQRLKSLRVCQVCSNKFESNSTLARHIEREHADFNFPLYSCDICPKKFTVFEKCIRHRTFHRRSLPKPKNPTKDTSETTCKICNKEFRVDYLMLRHLSEAHSLSLELFQCDQCGRKFSTEMKLRKHHYNSHRENKTLYVCSHCGQKFEKKLTLKDHETKHLGAPAYKCDLCEKTFIHKHSLDRHALVHSDVKQFACDICGKTFKRNTTLVIHRRIHTGEKPYLCEPCGLRFIDSSTLIKHRQRVHAKTE